MIFHLHHNSLDVFFVGLRTDGVDFAAKFLRNKSQLFTITDFFIQCFEKIFAVVGQPYFFFVDIEFFKIKNQFLFETVFIDITVEFEAIEAFGKTVFQTFNTLCFKRLNLFQQVPDAGHISRNVVL